MSESENTLFQKNLGKGDRIVRSTMAGVFIVLYMAGVLPGLVGLALTFVTIIFLATSAISFCPVYAFFNRFFNTKLGRQHQ